jgi:ABC-type iron transport system FetAB ATPase subunit
VPAGLSRKKVEDILGRVDLAGFGPKRTGQRSGGQKQRMAIARCLVLEPADRLLGERAGAGLRVDESSAGKRGDNHFLVRVGLLQQPVEMLYTDGTSSNPVPSSGVVAFIIGQAVPGCP